MRCDVVYRGLWTGPVLLEELWRNGQSDSLGLGKGARSSAKGNLSGNSEVANMAWTLCSTPRIAELSSARSAQESIRNGDM